MRNQKIKINLLFLFSYFSFHIFSNIAYSQLNYIERDLNVYFQTFNGAFKERITSVRHVNPKEDYTKYYDIVRIDTVFSDYLFKYKKSDSFVFVKLIKVEAKLKDIYAISLNLPYEKKLEIASENYYYISTSLGCYKLLGFWFSEVMLFYNSIDKRQFKDFCAMLVKYNVLNSVQGKSLYMSVVNEKSYYSSKLNYPCNILKYYYSDNERKKASTIILPYLPLRQNSN